MGKYFIKSTNTGIKFDLKASNGQVIGSSEVYGSEKALLNGIESVRKNAVISEVNGAKNPKFEVYNDKAGKFRFRLLARNGKNILASEAYESEAACLNGVSSVKKNSDSEIIKE
jgi:uncharacterized protein YegP (UPF0339 family)